MKKNFIQTLNLAFAALLLTSVLGLLFYWGALSLKNDQNPGIQESNDDPHTFPSIVYAPYSGTSIHIKDGINLKLKGSPNQEEIQKWLKRRKAWIDQFPFSPKYHGEVVYDENLLKHASSLCLEEAKSNAKRMFAWAKQYNEDRILKPWVPNTEHATSIKTHQQFVEAHSFLKAFFENPLIMTEEFEAIYQIISEYFPHPNPINLGWIYNDLRHYHLQQTYITRQQEQSFKKSDAFPSGNYVDSIINRLTRNSYMAISPDYEVLDTDQALIVLNRLLSEVPSGRMCATEPVTPSFLLSYYKSGFFISGKYEEELKYGDRFLIP